MSQVADHMESDRARRPGERVGRTVERMDGLPVLGVLLQPLKQRLHGLQILLRFRIEIRQDLCIERGHEIVRREQCRFRWDHGRQRWKQSGYFIFPSYAYRWVFSAPSSDDFQLGLERSHHPTYGFQRLRPKRRLDRRCLFQGRFKQRSHQGQPLIAVER